jgi:hypothetical protein
MCYVFVLICMLLLNEQLVSYLPINKFRDSASRGGGLALGIDHIMTFRELSHLLLAHLQK